MSLPEKIRTWKKPAKESEKSKLIKKVDAIFSEWVRLRDSDQFGQVICITCDAEFHWRETDCGHFQDRDNMGTRYHELNCNGQCLECNRYNPVEKDWFAVKIDERHGPGTAEKLERLARTVTQFEDHELKKMYEYYKFQVDELKEQKGMI